MEFLKKMVCVITVVLLFFCCGKYSDNSNNVIRNSSNSVDTVYWQTRIKSIDTTNLIYLECFNNNVSDTAKNYVYYLGFIYSDTSDLNFLSNVRDAKESVLYTGEKSLFKDSALLRVDYDEFTGQPGFLIVPLNPFLIGKEIFRTSRTGEILANKKQSIWLWLGEKDSKLTTREILSNYDKMLKVKDVKYFFW